MGERDRTAEDEGRKLFIGGLPFEARDEDLRDFFETKGCSGISDAVVILDRDSPQRSRGYGFITFYSKDDADKCKQDMDKTMMNERELRVDVAGKRREGGGRSRGGGGFGGSRSYGGGRSWGSGSGYKDYGSPYGGGRGRGSRSYGDRDSYGSGGGSRSYDRSSGSGGSYGSRNGYDRSSGGGSYGSGGY